MAYSKTDTQTNSKWISFQPAILGVLLTGSGAKLLDSVLNPTTAFCGEAPDLTFAYIFSGSLILSGLWQFWQSLAHSAAWTEDVLVVRDRLGQTQSVKFADLTNIEYGENGTRYIFGDRYVRICKWLSGASSLDEKFEEVIRQYAPHLGYIPAFRGALAEAETAGCLRCGSLCEPSDVTVWSVQTGNDEDDCDLGACPTCQTTESLLFGVNGNLVTRSGLDKWNQLLLDDLGDEEKAERLKELEEGRKIANMVVTTV